MGICPVTVTVLDYICYKLLKGDCQFNCSLNFFVSYFLAKTTYPLVTISTGFGLKLSL